MAEKNSVQDNAFFKIAQINAVEKFYRSASFDVCRIGLADSGLARILKKIIQQKTQAVQFFRPLATYRKSTKQKILDFIHRPGLTGSFFSALIYWVVWLRDSRLARKTLPPLTDRLKTDNPFLFVSYFPNIDEEAGKKGIFRNKYALPLQDKLAELNIPITWLIMPVYYNNHHFASSMQLAKKFSAQGENIVVLQEFFTLKVFFKAFRWWLRQCWLSFKLLGSLKKEILTGSFTHPDAMPILKYLWWHSFIGASGTRGIIFYLTYLEVFKVFPNTKTCLYYCEMQAWEKALIMAKKKQSPATQTIAFQHTVVMENFFNYFYHNDEIKTANSPADFPLPDQLLANGKLMHTLLAKTNYPVLHEVEAIRHLYISQFDMTQTRSPDKIILLVVGSYDKVETKSLLALVYQAFPQAQRFEIWLKGSPVNPVEPLMKELGIDWQKANYHISQQPVSELLPATTIALVANTTVAIEALAFGCPLIIPLFADTMMMNPAVSTDADFQLVSHPEQLQQQVGEIMQNKKIHSPEQASHFIHSYWHLDSSIPRWTKILNTSCIQPT